MRISRRKRPDKPLIPHYNLNERIRVPEVRLLDEEGNNIGVLPVAEALQKAKEQELDLVEINPKANPPVAKLIDFTRFKYQKEKEMRKQKISSHVSDIKGVRLSIRIGDHDFDIRVAQAEKFIDRGDKVKPEIMLKGRENAHPEIAFEVIKRFFSKLNELVEVRYEQDPIKQGNKITSIIIKKS
ncbi:MAG: translation initiation factor IF-3 [Candidatus Magasanikbacteria bacterium RIFOXYC2_FULL_40_16]|uniref:Translation initiation factor IF-3 n=3 Tax=Candidatus Magasanikiibacteriota TaxID=1752731 RepID=A0A1F6NHW8_9BACT|nr:MAG: translation initiation factor IF-3 [Candidatus Magasanikbacteria bacterium RIFOXYA2_FULL_40_20]OGH83461.1 MAG: translation initiation factor IF-3 [Candidatus Magasanikbacteria bacterium RIFOXYB1_FULL_40_15]OGH86280.1 MAG: translation initiation factor IF-3 [Candidatus Magasanikbacteria bacterium RIFOXYB2_FULL_40_13]OGH87182.1 MAG: translation initiation factor IF-3 [Candidatus Magasanikbacteria bacterium RIFOXYA1_FULL_40_8]OGH89662.1 MAG: translation initiation factor IF-3 [Candidatus M